jgi:GTP-binding protein EngB required for normal cell division
LATALEQRGRETDRMRFEAPPHESAHCAAVSGAPAEPVEALGRIAAISGELGAEGIAIEANELAERVSEGRFYVACVGQFKRGKSTLLNALVGEPMLPTGITPVTAVPTVIRFGDRHGARVRSTKGERKWISVTDLEQYVSEEHNPENARGIEGVEVFVPSPLLATGMCLVDTPGLGSVFSGNTATTQAFIPHIDAAVVVIGADPPISGEELALVEAVARHVHDFHIVLNKSDRVTDAERRAAGGFARKMLESRLQRPVDAIYEVSALERLVRSGPERDWGKFIAALEDLVEQSGRGLIRSAAERGVRRLGEQLLAIITEEREALRRPIEDSERRIAALHITISEAERSIHDLGYLFTAEQHRLSDLFLLRRKEFLKVALPPARADMENALRTARRRGGPSFRRHVMQQAQEIARKNVIPWLDAEEAYAEQIYRQASARFVDAANEFLRELAAAGVPELAQMPHALDPERGFRTRSRFTFHDFITLARPASIFRLLADVIVGALGAYGSIELDAVAFLERLLEVNSTRVQSDVNERVLESRHRLEADIRTLLREVAHVAERALAHARIAQVAGAAGVQSAVARLDALERAVQSFLAG